jgi:hypothetical protein
MAGTRGARPFHIELASRANCLKTVMFYDSRLAHDESESERRKSRTSHVNHVV